MNRIDIKTLDRYVLQQQLEALGQPKFRVKQVGDWLDKGVTSFDDMRNLPEQLRLLLADNYFIPSVKIKRKLVSQKDETVKYLFELSDGETVESVLMHYHHGWSQCLSTQVGCKMGCSFCATGMGGFVRNMTAAEMFSQIETAQKDHGVRVSSVVLMGMGEPLDNFEQVVSFLQMLNTGGFVNIGMRHVSLSTCGLVDRIYDLLEYKFQLTLSVSLHAPNDRLRSQIMPVNHRYSVEQLIKACRDYAEQTGRRISFEYAMIQGVNDTDDCAVALAKLLKGMLCHVNLIPANEVNGKSHQRSSKERIYAFQALLKKNGINATVRRTLGSDINASCGQLKQESQQ